MGKNSVTVADQVVTMFSPDYLDLVERMFMVVLGKRAEGGDGSVIGTEIIPASKLEPFFKKDSTASLLLGGLTWDDHSNFILSLFEFGVAWGVLRRSEKGKGAGFSLANFKTPEKGLKVKSSDLPADRMAMIKTKLDLIADPEWSSEIWRLDSGDGGLFHRDLSPAVYEANVAAFAKAVNADHFGGKKFSARGTKIRVSADWKPETVAAAA